MSIESILILILEAIRIYLYMRCFHVCIGNYRGTKKIAAVLFALLWGISCIIRSFIPAAMALETTPSLLLIEILFLFGASFLYQGSMGRRILMALLLPTVYHTGKWTMLLALFQTSLVNDRQYFIGTLLSVGFLCFLEILLERSQKSRQEQERELLEQEIQMYENQFNVIRQSQQSVRSLKHDMKHHIKMLADLIADGENEAALGYLASMGAFMENREEYVSSGNERIDSILNYMIGKAKAAGIACTWKIQIPEHLEISTFDINVILSNLFENALHALKDVKEPSLHILMKYDRGVLCINTRNKDSAAKIGSGMPSQTNEHGYGLKNIQRIAGKYQGSLTISRENQIFDANVILFIRKNPA